VPARSGFFSQTRQREFYFLEMNTPAGQASGDRTRYRIRSSARTSQRCRRGKLSFAQDDVRWHGHAIECRVYAEDPENNFCRRREEISFLRVPVGPGIRDDVTGVTKYLFT
jgi:acetyl-CoA carboxylase biotin carboxylase subunit